jgi:crotonobetainyl-CoA:carnitine CoA-transferase CaiB-like acyl-CoA transferase
MVGAHAALAMVAALEHRDRTGKGQLVEVPLLEVATAVTAEQVIRYAIDGSLMDRRGTAGAYQALGEDTWLAIDVNKDPMAPADRAEWCATRDPEAAAAELRGAGIPATAMVPGYLTLDDPQLRARGFFEAIDHLHVGRQEYPTWPMRMSAGPATYWTGPAPTLGEHTEEVLREELGVTDEEIARLRDAHVIGTIPYFGSGAAR